MDVDLKAIYKATEEKFKEKERQAELGKLQNPFEHKLDMANFYTSEAMRDMRIFQRIQSNTFRRFDNIEKERVKQALIHYNA